MAAAYKKEISQRRFCLIPLLGILVLVRVCSTVIVWKVKKYDGCKTASWRRNNGAITWNNKGTDRKRLGDNRTKSEGMAALASKW